MYMYHRYERLVTLYDDPSEIIAQKESRETECRCIIYIIIET